MASVHLLTPFQMFAGLSPDELGPVAGTAEEVELAAEAAVTTSTWWPTFKQAILALLTVTGRAFELVVSDRLCWSPSDLRRPRVLDFSTQFGNCRTIRAPTARRVSKVREYCKDLRVPANSPGLKEDLLWGRQRVFNGSEGAPGSVAGHSSSGGGRIETSNRFS